MAKKKTKIHHDHIAEGLRTLAVDITTLRQDPANARLHNDQNLEAIMSSLSKFGQRKPVVVNKRDGIVEAGNGTLQAAKALGWSHVAAVFVDDDPATATGFAIADNRTAELATWDEETLGKLLESIGDEMPAIELGFSDEQLAEIMAPLNEDPIGEDVEPTEPPKEPVSQRGEVFELGPHRLMCGDSTSNDDVAALMGGEKAHMVFTDPPYGVDYDGGTTKREKLEGDSGSELYDPCCMMAHRFSDEKSALYLWHAAIKGLQASAASAASAAGYVIRTGIIWNKNQAQFGALSAQYKQKHEPMFYCHKKGKSPRWFGPTNETTVWDVARSSKNEFHPTQKPTELAERAMTNSTEQGNLVLDLFLGSGATLIAAARQGRKCYGMEISPAYCDVIRKRWGDYARENDLEAGSGAL